MYRIAALVLLAAVTSPAWGEESALNFNPYDGTTTESTEVATTSDYSAKLTPSDETPPASALGLTPGFWKQDQHFYAWTGYTQTQSYKTVFGLDHLDSVPATTTLLDALRDDGGGESALARHAVAALLNATNPYVNYAYSKADIIAMVQAAYASGDYETTKDLLDTANNAGGEIPNYDPT